MPPLPTGSLEAFCLKVQRKLPALNSACCAIGFESASSGSRKKMSPKKRKQNLEIGQNRNGKSVFPSVSIKIQRGGAYRQGQAARARGGSPTHNEAAADGYVTTSSAFFPFAPSAQNEQRPHPTALHAVRSRPAAAAATARWQRAFARTRRLQKPQPISCHCSWHVRCVCSA